MASSFVSIEKTFLETLLKRADNSRSSSDFDKFPSFPAVTISKSEYDELIQRSREYDNLKQALYRGGVEQSSIETLIHNPDDQQSPATTQYENSNNVGSQADRSASYQSTERRSMSGHSGEAAFEIRKEQSDYTRPGKPVVNAPRRSMSLEHDDVSFQTYEKDDSQVPGEGQYPSPKSQTDTGENRTVLLKGIPERAIHRDIAAVVRGGALVDIFLRSRDRIASVSFANTKAAQRFFTYAKRNTLFIFDKPVDVAWSERQFSLSTYLATQITNGASRNLVIRGVHPNVTESMIRDDMNHIHNLIVVDVYFENGNAYISTNSVQKASFARNCMMSRMPYRLMRIEYYPDECMEPLPLVRTPVKKEVQRPAKNLNPMANRFQMLNIEDTDEDSDDEATSHPVVFNGGANWSTTVAA